MLDYLKSPTCNLIALCCFIATIFITPLVMSFAIRLGAVDQGGGYRKINKKTTPRLGGLSIAIPFIGVCVLGIFELTGMFRILSDSQLNKLAALAIGSGAIIALGIVDDTKNIRARYKLLGQLIVAFFICASGNVITKLSIPLIGPLYLDYFSGTFLTVIWIVGLTNAFNIIDGIDGLAAGIALIATIALGFIAAIHEATFVVLLCIALSGSLLSFLFFNFNPAKIFLGDTGSMFIGFALANISLMGSFKSNGIIVLLAPMIILGLPIAEMLISIVRRYIRGVPIFTSDSGHTHHRLLKRGFSQKQVAFIFYIATGVSAVAAVVYSNFEERIKWRALIPVVIFTVTLLIVIWLAGYIKSTKRVFEKRKVNKRLTAFSRYASECLNSINSDIKLKNLLELARDELELKYINVEFDDNSKNIIVGNIDEGYQDDLYNIKIKKNGIINNNIKIKYKHNNEYDEFREQAVQMCLAGIFDEFEFKQTLSDSN